MATKQINQLISATAIEDTDSIPIQTLAGLTKKFTPAILKDNLDGRYQQFGEVIWESENGEQAATGLTLTVGKVYDVYVNSYYSSNNVKGKKGLTIYSFYINETFPYAYRNILVFDAVEANWIEVEMQLGPAGINSYSTDIFIYKIVERSI